MGGRSCQKCGDAFIPAVGHGKIQKYCSRQCREADCVTTPARLCPICNTAFPAKGNKKYCCFRCYETATKTVASRFVILERDDFRCIYCGASPRQDHVSLHVDHVHPVMYGGDSTAANLVTACEACNKQKQDRLLQPAMQDEILAIVEQRNQARGINPQMIIKGVNQRQK